MSTSNRFAALVLTVALSAGMAVAQAPLTRFFVLPDTSGAPGSESTFSGAEGATSFAVDFSEPLRFNRGGFVTLEPDPGNAFVWNVVDFRIPGVDLAQGADLTFQRPAVPGPHGTWTSSEPTGFPDYANVTVAMTGDLGGTGVLNGLFPASTTLTMSGQIVPGYYHNVILLTGSFSGIAGGAMALYMKNDFYPPAVKWEMVVRSDLSVASVSGTAGQFAVRGGFSLQRGIANPNMYAVVNLAIEVMSPTPILITMPLAPNAGLVTFNPGTRGMTGALNVLIDGVPATIPLDGTGESFDGCVMHPTVLVIDDATSLGPITALHLEIVSTELVPANPPINDFQIGMTTSLVLRGRAGHIYGCAASLTPLPGINTPVGDIPVMPDDLFWISIDPANPYFTNTLGIMPPSGEVLININLPNEPLLIGATFFLGGGTFDPVTVDVLAATNSHRATVK